MTASMLPPWSSTMGGWPSMSRTTAAAPAVKWTASELHTRVLCATREAVSGASGGSAICSSVRPTDRPKS